MSVRPSAVAAGIALAGIVACTPACGSDPVEPPGPFDEEFVGLLYGEWEWLYATGGIAGRTIDPSSEGFSMRLVFSEPLRAELFRDGELQSSTTFEFVPARDLGDISQQARLEYADPIFGFESQEVGFSVEGELVLIDPCCDGFQWVWSEAGAR